MARMKVEITEERAEIVQWAVNLSGGQIKTAYLLAVTPVTVSRWTRALGPIPEAVFIWAKSVIREKAEKL